MWIESTRLVTAESVGLPLRSRLGAPGATRFIRTLYGLREFALGRRTAPADVIVFAGAELIDVYGNVRKIPTDTAFRNETLLGVSGDDWETDGIQVDFFWRTAVTRCEFVKQQETSGASDARIIWTVTWRIGRKFAVLNSHASFIN